MFTLILAATSEEIPLIDVDLTLVIQLALFLVLIVVLNQLLFRPYLRLHERRDQAILGRVREAERLEAEARLRLAELEARLAEAKAQAAEERAGLRAEGIAREKEIVEVARAEAARRLAAAKEEFARMGADLRAKLAPEVDALARKIASRALGREIQ
ncbi:MAG: hypothetical protein AABZ30_06385 [Myxococcota bacterium]